jgi:hypothetical protein
VGDDLGDRIRRGQDDDPPPSDAQRGRSGDGGEERQGARGGSSGRRGEELDCPECGATFLDADELERHRREEHAR